MVAQSNHVDLDILSELSRARDRLARCEGAREQADRAVEAARAAARRAHEAQGEARTLVARLEGELSAGRDRRPLLTAIEAAGRTPPGAAGPPVSSRVDPYPPAPRESAAAHPDPADRWISINPRIEPAARSLPTGLGEDDDDDTEEDRGRDYDEDMTAAVEAAEAARAARNGAANGHANGNGTAHSAREDDGGDYREDEIEDDPPAAPGPAFADKVTGGQGDKVTGAAAPPVTVSPGHRVTRSSQGRDADRRPGETVRAYRERRKAERHAAARPIRASGAQALEEFEAARAVGAAAPGPLPDPPAAEIPGYRACSAQQYRAADPADRHGTYRAVRTAAYEPDADLRAAESAPDGAPIVPPPPGDAWEGLPGWREATEREWLCAAPMDRHEHLRLVRTHQSNGLVLAEWRSEDLDARLKSALGWGGISERLTHLGRGPTAAEILEELGECWANATHIAKHAVGYRVRGGKHPAFWMGSDTSRSPTVEGAALVERVRRCLELAHPSADAVLSHRGSPPAARTGAYASDHTTGRTRRRKEAASAAQPTLA